MKKTFLPTRLTINSIKSMYKSGELTPEELIDIIIERSEMYADYNIWIFPPKKEIIKSYTDNLYNMDKNLPLWGIPFAVKDNIDVAKIPTTAACPAYEYIPESNAEVVERLIKAGAVPIGKTNLDQFATGLVGTRSLSRVTWYTHVKGHGIHIC
ncbi:MAG: hypothetical protein LUF26_00900, partial [Firmicutes bacterium]|nr:hypothetical protein [Bacillota bacterium]